MNKFNPFVLVVLVLFAGFFVFKLMSFSVACSYREF